MQDRIDSIMENSIDDHPLVWSLLSIGMIVVVIFMFAQAIS